MARLLKPFGIKPKTIRQFDRTVKGYYRSDFEDSWLRYLPQTPSQPSQPSQLPLPGAASSPSAPPALAEAADSKRVAAGREANTTDPLSSGEKPEEADAVTDVTLVTAAAEPDDDGGDHEADPPWPDEIESEDEGVLAW